MCEVAKAEAQHECRDDVQGYALVEYRSREEAQAAISELDRTLFLDQEIRVTWAFVKPPRAQPRRGGARR